MGGNVLMNLYMVELAVGDWVRAVAWYRDVLGLKVEMAMEKDQFALLQAGQGRVALKQATQASPPTQTGAMLVFEVEDVAAEVERLTALGVKPEAPMRSSAEGYRRAIFRDPDGCRVCLFDWNAGQAKTGS